MPKRMSRSISSRVFDAGGLCRTCKVLIGGDLRIGVGFQEISVLGSRDAKIQPRIAAEAKQPIDVARQLLQFCRELFADLGRSGHHAGLILIVRVPFAATRCDQGRSLRSVLDEELPWRQHGDALVAHDADVDFAALDVFLRKSRRRRCAMNEVNTLHQFDVVAHDRCARYSDRALLGQRFDEQRKLQCRSGVLWCASSGRWRTPALSSRRRPGSFLVKALSRAMVRPRGLQPVYG